IPVVASHPKPSCSAPSPASAKTSTTCCSTTASTSASGVSPARAGAPRRKPGSDIRSRRWSAWCATALGARPWSRRHRFPLGPKRPIRQREVEGSAAVDGAFGPDAPPVLAQRPLRRGKPDAPTHQRVVVEAPQGAEELAGTAGVEAEAVVTHEVDRPFPVARLGGELDPPE